MSKDRAANNQVNKSNDESEALNLYDELVRVRRKPRIMQVEVNRKHLGPGDRTSYKLPVFDGIKAASFYEWLNSKGSVNGTITQALAFMYKVEMRIIEEVASASEQYVPESKDDGQYVPLRKIEQPKKEKAPQKSFVAISGGVFDMDEVEVVETISESAMGVEGPTKAPRYIEDEVNIDLETLKKTLESVKRQ